MTMRALIQSIQGENAMNDTKRQWNECSVLCSFLAEHESELSKETRTLLERRIAAIIEGVYALDNPPQPY